MAGLRDDKPGLARGGPDPRASGGFAGPCQPAANACDHRPAAGRLHRRGAHHGCQPAAAAGRGLPAAGVAVGGGHPVRRRPGAGSAEAARAHPPRGDQADHPRSHGDLGVWRGVRGSAAGHVQRGRIDDRGDPGRVGTDRGRTAAALRPAHRTAAARAGLGGIADRPGRRHPRGGCVQRGAGGCPSGAGLSGGPVPGHCRDRPGRGGHRRRIVVVAVAQTPAR